MAPIVAFHLGLDAFSHAEFTTNFYGADHRKQFKQHPKMWDYYRKDDRESLKSYLRSIKELIKLKILDQNMDPGDELKKYINDVEPFDEIREREKIGLYSVEPF